MGASPSGRSVRRFAVILSFVLGLCAVAAAGVWMLSPAGVEPSKGVTMAVDRLPREEVSSVRTTPPPTTTRSSVEALPEPSPPEALAAVTEVQIAAKAVELPEPWVDPAGPEPAGPEPAADESEDDGDLSDDPGGQTEPEQLGGGSSPAGPKKRPPVAPPATPSRCSSAPTAARS